MENAGAKVTTLQIEARAREIIERAQTGGQNEDTRAELKREWPQDRGRAAAQLAGLCNAALGETVFWIVGVDNNGAVPGAPGEELSEWWASVSRCFDSVAPSMREVPFKIGEANIVAMYFETDRAPFIVKSSEGGLISHWVPWRDGTRLRAATRHDLLKTIAPLQKLPALELISAYVRLDSPDASGAHQQVMVLDLYAVPQSIPTVIPKHRCSVTLHYALPNSNVQIHLALERFISNSHMVTASEGEAVMTGPGEVSVASNMRLQGGSDISAATALKLSAKFGFAGCEATREINAEMQLKAKTDSGSRRWEMCSAG